MDHKDNFIVASVLYICNVNMVRARLQLRCRAITRVLYGFPEA